MFLLIVAGTARYIDLADRVHVGCATRSDWYQGVGLSINDLILFGPLAASVAAISYNDTIAQRGVKLLALFHLALCAGKIPDFATEVQDLPLKRVAVSFDVAHCALLAIDVRHIVQSGKATDRKLPIFMKHARLEK